jgi:predicted adenine nucleotide alpha hydrolase (AANH) superfamily ATPase
VGFEVTGFFYNPNIHPFGEYQNRKLAIETFIKSNNTEVIFPEYNPAEFFHAVHQKENNGRCSLCWSLRLSATAKAAKARGFTHFSTTLLVSPYQDQELLKKIGHDTASAEGVEFYYEDFRPGFKKAHEIARSRNIYCQKYCGCLYSELERCKQSPKR